MYIIWWINTLYGSIIFINLIYVITITFTIIIAVLSAKLRVKLVYSLFLRNHIFLLIPLAFIISVLLFYPGFSTFINSDGAAYLDLSRRLVIDNTFGSHLIQSPKSWAEAQWSTGMIDHFFGYSAIAIFFGFGNTATTIIAKFMLVFIGTLTIFPIYLMSEKLFNKNVARIAALIVSFSPIFLYHLSLIGGPDIVSALFSLVTICLLLVVIDEKKSSIKICILAGISFFVSWYAWLLNGYVLVLFIPVMLLIFQSNVSLKSLFFKSISFFILVLSFFLDIFVIGHVTLRMLGIPLPLFSLIILVIFYCFKNKIQINRSYLLYFITSLFLVFFATYLPRVISIPFIQFDVTNFPSGSIQITANTAQTAGILSRALDFNRVTNVANGYLFGQLFSWTGLLSSIGIITIFLAIASFARKNKMKMSFLVLGFPIIQMVLWILLSPTDVVPQPRYLLSSSFFYFILSASCIDLIAESTDLSKTIVIKIKAMKTRFLVIKRYKKIIVVFLMLFSFLAFYQPIYGNLANNMNYWDYRTKYNWDESISWINNNTTPKDVLAAVYADYFVWYTNRDTAFLWRLDPNASLSTLINLIRETKINYLIVDKPFSWQFSNLKGLYDSPKPFFGCTIVFMNQNSAEYNVIIYNVTNIAQGILLKTDFALDWQKLENWQPLKYYSDGKIFSVENSIGFNLKVANTPWPSAASTFSFQSPIDLSNYSTIEFWISTSKSNKTVLEIYSGNEGQNYFSYFSMTDESGNWSKVVFDLSNQIRSVGNPTLQNVAKMNFIVNGLLVGETYTFHITGIRIYKELYILN